MGKINVTLAVASNDEIFPVEVRMLLKASLFQRGCPR
jgi:hypothetical protein